MEVRIFNIAYPLTNLEIQEYHKNETSLNSTMYVQEIVYLKQTMGDMKNER